ncbi:MAG TPA: hypothetical protein VFJ06_09115 [Halococcus sp.]|nr:hypothetical protein [Halococcus sp.]
MSGRRVPLFVLALLASFGFVPVVSAHGGHVSVNGVHLSQWYGLIPLVLGIAIVLGSRYLPRILRPAYAKYELYGVFAGLVVAVFGAIWLVQLSPVEWYTVKPLIPRSLHARLMLLIGAVIMLASVLGGQLRWPRRPRYAGLGVLLGCWVAYPGLSAFGIYTDNNPLGYLLVFALAGALCYVLWRDARGVIRRLYADRVARRFGIAVGLLSIVFFTFSTGMLYVVPDEGVGISLSQRIIAIMPVSDPLVIWPALEFWLPRVPIGGMISVGTALLIGLFGGLIGLNAALFAFQSERSASTGASQTTAGVAGVAAPQACCCCGPALAQIAVVTLGPSAAAPIYLLFADPTSSIGSLFFVASVAILTGTLIYAGRNTPRSSSAQQTVPSGQSS